MAQLKRTLYVGIGGTGVATLLKVKKHFYDSYGEIPPMIGFLAIDTDRGAENCFETSSSGVKITLDPAEILVCTVNNAPAVISKAPQQFSWMPTNNRKATQTISGNGAGQIRSNGHFIATYNRKNIDSSIKKLIANITAMQGLNAQHTVINSTDLYINVVSSIAGGSGSGMLIDVLCMIDSVKGGQNLEFRVYPWILLPEIFRTISTGPAMTNVLYNTYGALKELDYIEHHNSAEPINYSGYQISESLFDYAYIINNFNKVNDSIDSIDELHNVMALSMFLPAGVIGNQTISTFDNILAQKVADTFTILNKNAWAASVASSELIYDNKKVGEALVYRAISLLCTKMLNISVNNGLADAINYVNAAGINEHEADQLIDSFLTPPLKPSQELFFDDTCCDPNTLQQMIDKYYDSCFGIKNLQDHLQKVYNQKLATCIDLFDNEENPQAFLRKLMHKGDESIRTAVNFLEALDKHIQLCMTEMTEESAAFKDKLKNLADLKGYLNIKKTVFLKSVRDEDLEDALKQRLSQEIIYNREIIRRQWALKFYNAFMDTVLQPKLQAVKQLEADIKRIEENCNNKLQEMVTSSGSPSKFQIYLHTVDVINATSYNLTQQDMTNFTTYLNGGMSQHIGKSQKQLYELLCDFVDTIPAVGNALNVTINDVLKRLNPNDVTKLLNELKSKASPLWTTDTQGFVTQQQQLDSFYIVGVDNNTSNIICSDKNYNSIFTTQGHSQPTFVSTERTDRISVLAVEDLLPIFAVNNFKAYENDHNDKIANGNRISNFTDQNLNQQMASEKFHLLPTLQEDNTLLYWVYGFVFDLIHFDDTNEKYWIASDQYGDVIDDRFDLGKSRDEAFNVFKNKQIDKEVETKINDMTRTQGNAVMIQKVKDIQSRRAYIKESAQISRFELDNLNDPKFSAIKSLIEQEKELIRSLKID